MAGTGGIGGNGRYPSNYDNNAPVENNAAVKQASSVKQSESIYFSNEVVTDDYHSQFVYGPQLIPTGAGKITEDSYYGAYTASQKAQEFLDITLPAAQKQLQAALTEFDPNNPNQNALTYAMGILGITGADTDTDTQVKIDNNLQATRDHMLLLEKALTQKAYEKMDEALKAAKELGSLASIFGKIAIAATVLAVILPGIGALIAGVIAAAMTIGSAVLNYQVSEKMLDAKKADADVKMVGVKVKETDEGKKAAQQYMENVMEFKTQWLQNVAEEVQKNHEVSSNIISMIGGR